MKKNGRVLKVGSGLHKSEIIFMVCILFLPLFHHILNSYILGAYNLVFTFQKYDAKGNLYWVGFQNFETAWNMIFADENSILFHGLVNGLTVWVVQNIVMFPVTMIFSFYMSKRILGHKTFRFVAMLPVMVTGLIMSQIYQSIMEGPLPQILMEVFDTEFIYFFQDPSKTFGTLLGFLLWTGFGSTLIIYPNAMNAIDKNIVEASVIDGADDLRQFWHIYLPGIWPTLTVTYLTAMGVILTTDLPNYLFYGYNAPYETYTMGYYIFKQTMKGGDNVGPVLNAINYMLAPVSVGLSLLWKYVAENYGPTDEEPQLKKKKLIDVNSGR